MTRAAWILFEEPLPPEVFVCIGGQGRQLDYENGPVETQREKDEESSGMDFLSPPQSRSKAYIRMKRKENSL